MVELLPMVADLLGEERVFDLFLNTFSRLSSPKGLLLMTQMMAHRLNEEALLRLIDHSLTIKSSDWLSPVMTADKMSLWRKASPGKIATLITAWINTVPNFDPYQFIEGLVATHVSPWLVANELWNIPVVMDRDALVPIMLDGVPSDEWDRLVYSLHAELAVCVSVNANNTKVLVDCYRIGIERNHSEQDDFQRLEDALSVGNHWLLLAQLLEARARVGIRACAIVKTC